MAFSFGGQSSAAQASGGFGFGAAPASSGGMFGASFSFAASAPAQSQPAFGNPFGQPQSQPAAGGLFGAAPAASAPSLFGASSSAFSFAAASSAASLFGAPQPASAPSLFGASQPALGGGFGFGQPASQPAAAFGQAQTQLAPAQFAAGLPLQQPDYSALKELEAIAAAYTPGSGRHRFAALLLNVVDQPGARGKPPGVDELQWRAALQRAGGPGNADRLWPVQARGFGDLLARKAAQDEALREHAQRMDAAEHFARQLERQQATLVRDRIESVRQRHLELSHQLLRVMQHVDALEGRFAASRGGGGWGGPPPEAQERLQQLLGDLEAAIAPASAGGLQRQVEALATAARLQQGAPAAAGDVPRLDGDSLASIFAVLQQQTAAIGRLQDVLRRSGRDLAILSEVASAAKA